MSNIDSIRVKILELCSEGEYGSWEFWSSDVKKTKDEAEAIFQALISLVNEKKIEPMEHKFQGPYDVVELDTLRLKEELARSMEPDVDPDSFYWFTATEAGKEEDLKNRSVIA